MAGFYEAGDLAPLEKNYWNLVGDHSGQVLEKQLWHSFWFKPMLAYEFDFSSYRRHNKK